MIALISVYIAAHDGRIQDGQASERHQQYAIGDLCPTRRSRDATGRAAALLPSDGPNSNPPRGENSVAGQQVTILQFEDEYDCGERNLNE